MSPTNETNESASIADCIADREGLNGSARAIFVRLLRTAFGYESRPPGRITAIIVWGAVCVAVFGVLFESRHGSNAVFALMWIGIAAIGATLAWGVARAQLRIRPADIEIEWRAYCILLRPLILNQRPGLLDRNRHESIATDVELRMGPGRTLIAIVCGHPISLWMPATLGWGAGSVGVMIWRGEADFIVWCFGLPILGILLAIPFWCLVRLVVFRRVEKATNRET